MREDLRLLVMSATLDGARVASLMADAPLIESEGRAFPVETRYVGRDPSARIEDEVARVTLRRARERDGLDPRLPAGTRRDHARRCAAGRADQDSDVDIAPLYGAMDSRAQDLAIAPAAPGRRKIVLATSIAETSLTIEGVRVVIDSGLMRVPRFEPDIGLTRLETVRVSRPTPTSGAGARAASSRASAIACGKRPQTAVFPPYARPEISQRRSLRLRCSISRSGASPIPLR